MGIEIEKKYELTRDARAKLRRRLRAVGAQLERTEHEENILFAGRGLDQKRAILRMRRCGALTLLTYKERISERAGLRHQREDETEVADAAALLLILQAIGLAPGLIYEKRREVWRLDGVEIDVDELPFGLYVELEGSARDIEVTEKLLRLDQVRAEPLTYPALTARLGAKRAGVVEARFSKTKSRPARIK